MQLAVATTHRGSGESGAFAWEGKRAQRRARAVRGQCAHTCIQHDQPLAPPVDRPTAYSNLNVLAPPFTRLLLNLFTVEQFGFHCAEQFGFHRAEQFGFHRASPACGELGQPRRRSG